MAAETLSSRKLPTVELGELGLQHAGEPSQQEWERVTRQLEQVLSQTGYAYLTQHGLPDDVINGALSAGYDFFQLGMKEKMNWSPGEGITGYIKSSDEIFSGGAHDLKESFIFKRGDYNLVKKEPPPFDTAVTPFCNLIQTLSTRLMASFSRNLGKPEDYFAKMHAEGTNFMFRFNYHKNSSNKGKNYLVSMGAHVDFSTFTLLVSNNASGLQVRDPSGQWTDVPGVPGSVLLMGGELLYFYSNKRFKAPEHRVVLPSEEQQNGSARISLVFFLQADGDTPTRPPSDDPASSPPLSATDYLTKRLLKAREQAKNTKMS